MEIVENTLECSLDAFLERPLVCFLAQSSPDGPRVSPLWYRWEDGAVWIIATRGKSYLGRIETEPRTALAIVDFDVASGRFEHVGMRGRASIEPYGEARGRRLLAEYLGEDRSEWDDRFVDLPPDEHALVRFDPETVVARDQSYEPAGDG